MRLIGKYKGHHCYLISQNEYLKERFYKNRDSIFIMENNGEMVYQNKRIGCYDGRRVKDYNEPFATFYYTSEEINHLMELEGIKPKEEKKVVAEKPQVKVEEGLAPQIDFKDYDKEVDRFFEEYNRLSNDFVSLMASV